MPVTHPPVAIIAPFGSLASLAEKVAADFPRPLLVLEGDLAGSIKPAQAAVKKGTQVFVSRGGTASLLKTRFPQPVIEIAVSPYDVLNALVKGNPEGLPAAVVAFSNVISGILGLNEILNLDLLVEPIGRAEDVRELVDRTQAGGRRLIVGDQAVVSRALEKGYPHALVESGRESILAACRQAYGVLDALVAKETLTAGYRHLGSQLKTVMHAVDDPVLILDERLTVLQHNPAAAVFFGADTPGGLTAAVGRHWQASDLRGHQGRRNIIIETDGRRAIFDLTPVTGLGQSHTLAWGRSLEKVERSERAARRALYNLGGHQAKYRFGDIISDDPGFLKLLDHAKEYSKESATILITGETGTGKELLAQSIHNHSLGPERPFVAVNCASLPEQLLESELFGYVKGAFTGARSEGKKGLFELAHGGSLLLDEIGEMPLNLQSRLLRVIEEKAVRPLGGNQVVPVNVRLMAATNVDVEQAVAERRFRRDLYYRLAVLILRLPPLRARGQDAHRIFLHLVDQHCPGRGKYYSGQKMKRLFLDYDWPGNLRELSHLAERLRILTKNFTDCSQGKDFLTEELSKKVQGQPGPSPELPPDILEMMARQGLLKKGRMAELMGVSRSTLWRQRKREN